MTVHELTDPVAQDTYRGRELAITVDGGIYVCWVDGEHYHDRSPRLGGKVDMLDRANIEMMLDVLRLWIDTEQRLRDQFPVGTAARTIPSQQGPTGSRCLTGIVTGHKSWLVTLKIIETNYASGPKSRVGDEVHLRGDQLEVPDPYPEHTKLAKLEPQQRAAEEFLEWLLGGTTPYVLSQFNPRDDRFYQAQVDTGQLVAEWLGIDRDRLAAEALAMHAQLGEQHNTPGA